MCRTVNILPKGYFSRLNGSLDGKDLRYEMTKPTIDYSVNKTYHGAYDCRKEFLLILVECSVASAKGRINSLESWIWLVFTVLYQTGIAG